MVQSLVQKKTQNVCIDWVTIHATARRSIYRKIQSQRTQFLLSLIRNGPQLIQGIEKRMQTTTNTKSAHPETYIEKQQEEKSTALVPVLWFGPFFWPLLSPRYSQLTFSLYMHNKSNHNNKQQSNVVTNVNGLSLHKFTFIH